MKLVDLDDDRHVFCGEDGDMEKWNIDPGLPTVDAIPIEWLENYIDENPLYQTDDFHWYVRDMIHDWEAEREEE